MLFKKKIPGLFVLYIITATSLWANGAKEDIIPSATNWTRIVNRARGTSVTFCMWGGAEIINTWVDTVVAEGLKKNYGITLKRIPMEAEDFVKKLSREKQEGIQDGELDLLWINGENFRKSREANLLWGPFAEELPNFKKYVDPNAANHDFGYPTDGYEAPYGESWFILIYDTKTMLVPPEDFNEFSLWMKSNPGRFTYPKPPNFTGSAFLRTAFYYVNGGADNFLGKYNQVLADEGIERLKSWLAEITPYLWKEGRQYPEDSIALDELFINNEVDFSMSYNVSHVSNKIARGEYNDTVRSFILDSLALFNYHFTAIPFNAPNKSAALVLANYLLSPEIQMSKMAPINWGDATVLDPYRMSLAEAEQFNAIVRGPGTLPREELTRNAVPEIAPQYVEQIERFWVEFVASLQ